MRAHPDARLMALGECNDLVPGLLAVDLRAGDKDGACGAVKRIDESAQRFGIGAHLAAIMKGGAFHKNLLS